MVFLTISALLLASVTGVPPIPTAFARANAASRTPLWVSARIAVDEHQSLRADALEPYQYRMTQQQVDAKKESRGAASQAVRSRPAQCDVRFAPPTDLLPSDNPTTWAAVRAMTDTHTVVDGTVTATDVGFFAGIPATVIEVSQGNRPPAFLLLLTGSVAVDGVQVCTVAADVAATPTVGDSIVALLGKPIDKDKTLYHVSGGRLFLEHDGRLLFPPHIATDGAPSLRTLNDIRQALNREPGAADHKK